MDDSPDSTSPGSPPPRTRRATPALPSAPPLRVLVVDDDDDAREMLKEAVTMMGHDCREAKDGLEAWEMHLAERMDVILSDWSMPRMNGMELCRRTRAHDEAESYTYFIFMTGFSDRDHFTRGIDAGADDYHRKPVDVDELGAQLASARRVILRHGRLVERNALLLRAGEASFHAARIDPLTAAKNRLSMDEDLRNLWSRVMRYGHRYSLAMCDVDRFKEYNDAFGHMNGDVALQRVARAMRGALREGDGLYRFGGEEFVVVLPEQSIVQAAAVMERVRAAVEALGLPGARPGSAVTVSIGVAELDRSNDHGVPDWLSRADAAVYRAKAQGRNRVEVAGG